MAELTDRTGADDILRRYLLGRLGPEELDGIEDRLFSDDRIFWERLCLVEDDLADAHAWGRLDADDRAAFERHFLCSAERRAKAEFARALRESIVERRPRRAGMLAWLAGPVHVRGWAVAAAAVLIVALVPAVAWRLASPASPDGIVTAWLAAGQIRDVGQQTTRVAIPAGCQVVRLPLETAPGGGSSYGATLFEVTDGEVEVLAQHHLVAGTVDGKLAVTLALPCELLRDADYVVNLQDESPGRVPAGVGRYSFRVLRQ